MTTSRTNLLQLAKQGNPKAIASLINRSLQPKGITAKAVLKNGCLQVMLESSTQVPDQAAFVAFVSHGVSNLGVESIKTLRVFGKQMGEDLPAWIEELQLQKPVKDELNHMPSVALEKNSQQYNSSDIISEFNSERKVTNSKIDKLLSEPTPKQKAKLKWYETDSPTLIIGLLIIFFPIGLWSMWKYAKWSPKTKAIITGVIALLLLVNSFNQTSSEQTATARPSSTQSRTFIGTSPTGYQLWADASCVYVVGITEADLARLNTDVWGFKEAVKSQTGYRCVLFE